MTVAASGTSRRRATTPVERLEAELTALRAENARLRRRLAAETDEKTGAVRKAPADRAAHVRSMLRDRASRNP